MNQDWNIHTERETRKRRKEEGAQQLDNDDTLDDVMILKESGTRKKMRWSEAQTEILVSKKVYVPSDKIDFVVGENYANVIRLETTYGVKLAFPPEGPRNSILLISGTHDQVEAAKLDIIENLPYELTYSIDDLFIIVISNCCENLIQNLCASHNVNIHFGVKQVRVSGKKRSCDDAMSAIKHMIKPLLDVEAVFIPFEKQGPMLVKEKVVVPLDVVGLVAGKQFANVIRLQETYGVKVTVPPVDSGSKEVLVEGYAEQVAAAKVDILENVYILTRDIDTRFIGLIIGRQGEGLKRLSEVYDIGIRFEDNKTVYITGKKERCEAALSEIDSIVKKQLEIVAANIKKAPVYLPPVFTPIERQQPGYVKDKVVVPLDMVGLIAGKQFANVNRLQETYGVKVNVPAKDSGNNEILVEGLLDRVAAAKVDILENLYVLPQDIDTRFVGLIIGHKGEGLNRLSKDHNLLGIKFVDNKTVFITGKRERCEAALSEINSIVEMKQLEILAANIKKAPVYIPFERQQARYIKDKVIVPLDVVGLVAGKKFANVIRLQETYGVKVTVPAKDSGRNEIFVEGFVEQVAAAKIEINSIVENCKQQANVMAFHRTAPNLGKCTWSAGGYRR